MVAKMEVVTSTASTCKKKCKHGITLKSVHFRTTSINVYVDLSDLRLGTRPPSVGAAAMQIMGIEQLCKRRVKVETPRRSLSLELLNSTWHP